MSENIKKGDVFTLAGCYGGSWWDRLRFRLGWGPPPPLKEFVVTETTESLAFYEPAEK